MSNNIAVITQDEFELSLLPNPNLTMAIPSLSTLPVAQFPKNKLLQMTMFGRVAPPSPETRKNIQVQGHNSSLTQVYSHLCKINGKPHGNKKESETTKSKKKTGKPKYSAFRNGQDDCKESVQLGKTLHLQELWDLMNNNKK
jgi:hypothetical protein